MARETLFETQEVSGFEYMEGVGYVVQISPAPFTLTVGETYVIVLDGKEYTRTAYAFDSFAEGTVAVGNDYPVTGVVDPDNFPVIVGYQPNADYIAFVSLSSTTNMEIGVYKEVAEDAVYYSVSSLSLKALGNAIRAKSGTGDALRFPDGMVEAVGNITGGSGGGSSDYPDAIHTVTFMNGGEELRVRAVVDGDNCADVADRGLIEQPAKESTAQYEYTYSGWSLTDGGSANSAALSNVTGDRTVYAAYTSALRKYTITFYDDDGATVLNTQSVAYGSKPSYTPTKDGAVFDTWVPALATVTGDASYTAKWTSVLASGECGDDLAWTLSAEGLLTVSGTGDMYNTWTTYQNPYVPWKAYLTDITEVVIEPGATSVGKNAFNNCINLTAVSLPEGITTIDEYAFNGCKSLTNVSFPESLTTLNSNSFSTSGLETVSLSTNVVYVDTGAFYLCESLKRIDVAEGNASYCNDELGVLFNKGMTEIIKIPCAIETDSYTVPESITVIPSNAFRRVVVKSVVLHDKVTELAAQAFYQNVTIEAITIPGSVTKIGRSCFEPGYNMTTAFKSITFENTNGWWVSADASATSGTAVDVTNPTTNATNLTTGTYKSYYWNRS